MEEPNQLNLQKQRWRSNSK